MSADEKRGDAHAALELVKAWLAWRVWLICVKESPLREMNQGEFATRLGVADALVSGLVNRKAETHLGDTWIRIVDYLRMTPEDAFAQARLWRGSEEHRRWTSGDHPIAPTKRTAEFSDNLKTAIVKVRKHGITVSDLMAAELRATLAERDWSVDEWAAIVHNLHRQDAAGLLARRIDDTRTAQGRTRHPRTHRGTPPKT